MSGAGVGGGGGAGAAVGAGSGAGAGGPGMAPRADRLLLVPRWGGAAGVDFYPWLGRRLAQLGWRGEVEPVGLRPPDPPDLGLTVAAVRQRLASPARVARTVVLGHSVGAQAAMRAVAELPEGAAVAGLLLVAGWWQVDEPWPSIQPWMDQRFDVARVAAAARRRVVLLSTNDPFTADWARSQRLFEERIAAEVRVVEGAGHFNGTEEPAVLRAVCELVGAPPG